MLITYRELWFPFFFGTIMIIKLPLTLHNWESLEQMGYTVKPFKPEHYDRLTHINVLTSTRRIRATHARAPFLLGNIELIMAINLVTFEDYLAEYKFAVSFMETCNKETK